MNADASGFLIPDRFSYLPRLGNESAGQQAVATDGAERKDVLASNAEVATYLAPLRGRGRELHRHRHHSVVGAM
jgi:hypothetical protein